jgi:hypothetical protein
VGIGPAEHSDGFARGRRVEGEPPSSCACRLVVAAGAFFTGPSTAAVRTRHALSSGLGRLRHGGESGPASRWTYAHRHALRIGAVALAALIFVFWGQPTAAVVLLIAILLLVVLGLIELIGGRPPAQPEVAGHP